ncbi:MAG: hypothetical protein JO084_00075 [Bradyrhizobiaceae bacterium]|nr:hypothetical protein [Bradyrhizobiaceae bacterium]
MRKLSTVFAVTILLVGLAVSAQAQTWRGSAQLNGAAQNFTPIAKVACGGRWGPWCPPGRHRVCGPRGRCWCAPC